MTEMMRVTMQVLYSWRLKECAHGLQTRATDLYRPFEASEK